MSGFRTVSSRLAVIAFAAIVFVPIVPTAFVSDDWLLLDTISRGGAFALWTHDAIFFRPLTSLLLRAEWQLFGLAPSPYHLVSIALHVATSLAVFSFVKALVRTGILEAHPSLPAFSAAIFAVFPCHAEPVSWVSAQGDLLAASFALFALSSALRETLSARFASAASMALALSSKESALAIPFVAILVTLAIPKLSLRSRILRAAPLVLTLALYLPLRRLALGRWIGGYGADLHLDFGLRALTNAFVYTLRTLLPPLLAKPLDPDSFPFLTIALSLGALIPFASISAFRRRALRSLSREASLGFVLFLLAALPVLTLRLDLRSLEAERILYLPSAFLALSLARAMFELPRTRGAPALLIGSFASALFVSELAFREAAHISQTTLTKLLEAPSSRILFVGVPDSYRGAGILRNGLDEALHLLSSHPPRVVAVAFLTMHRPTDGVRLVPNESGWDARAIGDATLLSFDDPPRVTYEDDNESVRDFGSFGLHLEPRGELPVLASWASGDLVLSIATPPSPRLQPSDPL